MMRRDTWAIGVIALLLGVSVPAAAQNPVTIARNILPIAVTLQNAATANGNGTTLPVGGYITVVVNVICATCSGGTSVQFEGTVDGTTFVPILAWQLGATTIASSTTASGDFQLAVAGYQSVRARIASYAAGTVTVKGYRLAGGMPQPVTNALQSGPWTVQPGNTANTTPWLFSIAEGGATAQVTATAGGSLQVECASGCGGSGGTSIADDADFTAGTTQGTPAIGVYESAPTSVTDGDVGIVGITQTRALRTAVEGSVTVTATNLDVQSGGADLATETTAAAILTSTNFAAAFGTAGTADTQVLSIQGIASMTPVQVNPGTASQFAIYVEDQGETVGGNLMMAGTVRRDTAAASAGTTGDNATLNTDANGLLWARFADPCSGGGTKTYFPVDIVTATTTEIADAVASQYFYVCSVHLFAAGTVNVAFVEDDTDACASPTAGVFGGTTAAEGWNLTAQTGVAFGNGTGGVARTAAQNRYICLITSAAVQVNGHIVVAAAP